MYDLSTVVDLPDLSNVESGTAILVTGPAMTGKQQLAMNALAEGCRQRQGALTVSTDETARNIVEELRQRVDDLDELRVGVVDCRSDEGHTQRSGEGGPFIHHVSSPGDLTGIGVGITECLESLNNHGADSGRLALLSLSTMLSYSDTKTVFKFCHVLSSRLDAANYLGLFTLDTGAHKGQTVSIIKQAFDGVIELRQQDGRRQVRVQGFRKQPSDWRNL